MGFSSARVLRGVAIAVAGGATASLAYLTVGRGPCLTWGATEEEVAREMPGDGLLAEPDIVSTRAIGIASPPSGWLQRVLTTLLMEPGSLVMERKMLIGIRDRAERLAAGTTPGRP